MAPQQSHIIAFNTADELSEKPDSKALQHLTQQLAKFAPHDGAFDLAQGLQVVRASQPTADKSYISSLPSLCIVPQGAKAVSFAGNGFEYDESKMVVYAAELPIHIRILRASAAEPYFCFVIPITPQTLNRVAAKVFPNGVPKANKTRAVYVGESNPKIIASASRIMELITQQEDTDLLVPLVIDEILIRLLRSPHGASIAQIGVPDSHVDKISKAITFLQTHYTESIKMEQLASIAGMSTSSFHAHFKDITAMSPLQFQKTLRLREARNLIRARSMDISHIAFEVGYVSTTQFSREYAREFGIPPSKDV